MRTRGVVAIVILASCRHPTESNVTLTEARRGFQTHVLDSSSRHDPAPTPPPAIFSLVHPQSPAGSLAAYVSPRPNDGARKPAIVWISGGFDSSLDRDAWAEKPRDNDQTARAFRDAGTVLMLPSFRGANDNPGKRESFYGEVDDAIATARETLSVRCDLLRSRGRRAHARRCATRSAVLARTAASSGASRTQASAGQ